MNKNARKQWRFLRLAYFFVDFFCHRLNNSITRAEVASVACRMPERSADLDYIKANLSKLRSFSDVSESHRAYKPVMEAANGHDYEKTTGAESRTAITENK